MFDINTLRKDFPALAHFQSQGVCYFDSAATTQKPQCVIDVQSQFYREQNANVHRGAHQLSQHATSLYEQSRQTVANYINCDKNEVVWTRGATEAINLVAYGLTHLINENDTIVISTLEHHANIVPWQQLAKRTGAQLKALPIDNNGIIDAQQAVKLIEQWQPKVVAIAHVSNALGNISPIEDIIRAAKSANAYTLIDGAQSLLHLRPDVKALECDFFVFSAHKCLGPTGIGGLYGRYALLERLDVYQTGGEMVNRVTLNATTFNPPPSKFETGTPNISGVLGFARALNYLEQLEIAQLHAHEQALYQRLISGLQQFENVRVLGDTEHNVGIVSFVVEGEHTYDIATLLDLEGIALRQGQHCTQPLMAELQVEGTVRASLAFYNSIEDVDALIKALKNVLELISE